jgi:hypothetical protein
MPAIFMAGSSGSAGNFIFATFFHHLPWIPFCIIIKVRNFIHHIPDRTFDDSKVLHMIFVWQRGSNDQYSYYYAKKDVHKNHINSFQQFTVFQLKLKLPRKLHNMLVDYNNQLLRFLIWSKEKEASFTQYKTVAMEAQLTSYVWNRKVKMGF